MKSIFRLIVTISLVGALALGLVGCDLPGGNDASNVEVGVNFLNVTANGGATVTTTQLTLSFNAPISGLSPSNIILGGDAAVGVTLGTLTGTPPVYNLQLNGVTQGGNISVTVNRPGYNISNRTRNVNIFHHASSGGEQARTGRVTFNNTSNLQVSVRLGSFSGVELAELAAGASVTIDVPVSETVMGTTFAMVFMRAIIVDGMPLDGPGVFVSATDMAFQPTHVIEENGPPVMVQIPQPSNLEFRSSFLTILNLSGSPIQLAHVAQPLAQADTGNVPVAPSAIGLYRLDSILPPGMHEFANLSVRTAAGTVVAPIEAFTAQDGYIYEFQFDGTSVSFIGARSITVR